jgi:hypothetical protein
MKIISVINSVSILNDNSAIIKATDGRCYLIELIDNNHMCWTQNAYESFQEYLGMSELVLWGNDDLSTFTVSLKTNGRMSSVFTSQYQKIKEIRPAQALTLLLKAGKSENG